MKAITIKQPWASLIVHSIKDIENRTWPCPRKYIGQRVFIHAAGSHGRKFSINLTDAQAKAAFATIAIETMFGNMPFGSIIGSIEIAIEDYTTAPFPTFLHSCNKCGYVIMESEWNVIEK